MPAPERSSRETFAIVASWIVVLIPALWGVSQTITKSLALFK